MGRAEGIGGPGWELLEILDAWPWARGRLDAVLLLFRRQRAELPQQMLPLGV